jgi:L-rhamnose mutarotase
MQRVAEVIYVVPEEREAYLKSCLNPEEELSRALWLHGVRNQFYFEFYNLIFMTFEYVGNDFYKDMAELAAIPNLSKYIIPTRRKDVPVEQRETTNWWAPLKRFGGIVRENPFLGDEKAALSLAEQYHEMLGGHMAEEVTAGNDISFSDDDWSESVHF